MMNWRDPSTLGGGSAEEAEAAQLALQPVWANLEAAQQNPLATSSISLQFQLRHWLNLPEVQFCSHMDRPWGSAFPLQVRNAWRLLFKENHRKTFSLTVLTQIWVWQQLQV